jgi:hypothetical protein
LPKAFNAIIEYNTNFKVEILLNMIDKIYIIGNGNDTTTNISQIKIELAEMLNKAFISNEHQ